MPFQAKLDWKYGDIPTEQDANRWEQGIKDAHDPNLIVPRTEYTALEGRVKALENSLANDLRDNLFSFDFSSVSGMKISKGWWDKTNARLVIK